MPDKEDELQTNEWKQVVCGAKKRCTSSVFSMRDYSVHKCALENNVVVVVLAKFYNFVIQHNHYPSRWLKLVDIMLEKGKVPLLKK